MLLLADSDAIIAIQLGLREYTVVVTVTPVNAAPVFVEGLVSQC